MDAVNREEQQREVEAEVTVSAAAMPAPKADTPGRSRDATRVAAREEAADRRQADLDQREGRLFIRESDADERDKVLDEREHVITAREHGADQREIDAEVAVLDEAQRRSSERFDPEAMITSLGALALSLQDLDNVDATLRAIVASAVDTVPRASFAGLSVVSRRQVSPIVVSDEVVSRVNQVQLDTGEGPAVTSLRDKVTVRVDDLATETRWPRFAARAAQAGVASMLAVRMFVRRDELGILTLYSRDTYAFDDNAKQIAVVFTAHAAVALVGAQHDQHMVTALDTRDVIGQAKGILMERYRLNAEQAFAVLKRASQANNTKLVDVVRVLTDSGTLTGAGPDTDRHGNHIAHRPDR